MNVVISPNLRKTTQRIDINGNTLNRQGQIIELADKPYIPTKDELEHFANTPPEAPQAPTPIQTAPTNPLSIQEQIDEAKANLSKLEELKKLKIAEMKAQLELLEQ